MRVPAAVAACPLLAGVAIGLLDDGSSIPLLALTTAAGGALSLLAAAASYGADASHETLLCLAVGFLSSGVSLGASAASTAYRPPLAVVHEALGAGRPFDLEGTLREDAALSAFGPSLLVDVDRVLLHGSRDEPLEALAAPGGVRLTVAGDLAAKAAGEWRAGRRVRVTSTLREPAFYLDPGVRDDRRALARRGITLVGSVKSAALVDVRSRGSPLSEAAAALRAGIRERLARDVGRWSAKSAAIAIAILIGDRTGLPDADVRRLQDAGTYHVIAISGGNIAILTVIVFACLRALRTPPRSSALATIGVLTFYSAIVVSGPSVQRAIVAALVYLSARFLDHRSPALNVVAVAGVLGISAAPASLFDPGFLLSFGATLGIVAAVALRRPGPGRCAGGGRSAVVRGAIGWACGLLLTTAAAEVAILPIGAAIFGRVTFAGLLLNFAAIPMMTMLQAASIASLGLSLWSAGAAAAAGFVVHVAATAILESPRLLDVLPALARDVAAPPWWLVASYYVSLAGMVSVRRPVQRRAVSVLFAVALALVVAGPSWSAWRGPLGPPSLRVVFLDVGQADSTLIVTPRGKAMLVDAGGVATLGAVGTDEDAGGFDVGRRVVAPALRAMGVRELESLTLTHGDPDHIGGAASLLGGFHPNEVREGVPVPAHAGLRALIAEADTRGLRWRVLQTNDVERLDGVEVRVLHPPPPEWERQRVRNEDSIVVDVRFGDVSIVLPGDIGLEGEREVRRYLRSASIVVLKAPHHGSATSSSAAFLDALSPSAVVFSAGRNNRFGHPAPAVVSRYAARGVTMFSTAVDGAILVETDGKSAWIGGWTGDHGTWLSRRR